MKKKFIIFCVLFLLIIFIIIIFFNKEDNAKYEYNMKEIDRNYFLVYENKYGVINKEGKVVVEPQYDMIQIPNPEEPVFICLKNYNAETGEYKTKILNDTGDELFTNFYRVEAINISEPFRRKYISNKCIKIQRKWKIWTNKSKRRKNYKSHI